MKRLSVVMIVVIGLSILLPACGGGGGGGAAAAAKSFFDAFSQLDFTKMKDLSCNAQKANIEGLSGSLGSLGDASALKNMIKIDTSGLKFEEKSVNGSNATVVVSGKMKMEMLGKADEQDVNSQELPMVNEGGQWKVCGASGLLQ